jgi:hypothetical protein
MNETNILKGFKFGINMASSSISIGYRYGMIEKDIQIRTL